MMMTWIQANVSTHWTDSLRYIKVMKNRHQSLYKAILPIWPDTSHFGQLRALVVTQTKEKFKFNKCYYFSLSFQLLRSQRLNFLQFSYQDQIILFFTRYLNSTRATPGIPSFPRWDDSHRGLSKLTFQMERKVFSNVRHAILQIELSTTLWEGRPYSVGVSAKPK